MTFFMQVFWGIEMIDYFKKRSFVPVDVKKDAQQEVYIPENTNPDDSTCVITA